MDHFIRLKAALDWIERHLEDEITPRVVASVVCYSRSRFHTLFRAAVGMPLAAYIRQRRLCHAARDLVRGDDAILDIALRYGFASHEVFLRAFRREMGCVPSAFRRAGRALDSGVIVPGLFGPMPPAKEKRVSHTTATERGSGSTVLRGVPRVSYFSERHEVTPFSSSLRACLAYLGVDVPYASLLCASGAAFRLMWNTAVWDGGNVDIFVFDKDPSAPLRRACRAAGRTMHLLLREGNNHGLSERCGGAADVRIGGRTDFVDLVVRQIDRGRPLVGFGVIGPPEACVITGYREGGEVLVGWNYFQDMPEYAGGVQNNDEGCFERRGWYEHPETIALLALGDEVAPPTMEVLARETLSLAVRVMAPYRLGDHVGGQDAYEAWAQALEREEEFASGATLHHLMERQMCVADALTTVGEGRHYAGQWCDTRAELLPSASAPLKAASRELAAERDVTWSMWALLGGMGLGEKQARALARPEVRRKLVSHIREAKQHDLQAAGHLGAAVEAMA